MANEQTLISDAEPAKLVRSVFTTVFSGDSSPLEAHPGLAALKQHLPSLRNAFPDLSAELTQQLVDGDRVATLLILRGTNDGPLFGFPPTGKPVRFQNLSICRVESGRIVQYNSESGWLPALRQLGLFGG